MDTDDNFVSYGTALEPIEEEDIARKKPILVSDQIATDENGRRRFHGAFTGGFSAGYYNTVGSKEGWTPSTFKSSRLDRVSSKGQNVMDFMDNEDMGVFGIAPQVLRPTDTFTAPDTENSSRKRPKPTQSDGPIPGTPVLHQIIEPVKDTIGVRILIKMGWRPGQGIGPRVSKKQRNKNKKKSDQNDIDKPEIISQDMDQDDVNRISSSKVYGCQLPDPDQLSSLKRTDDEGSSDDEFESNILYAPVDVDSPLCNPKDNTFGLGYKGLERMTESVGHVDLFGKQLKFRVENKKLNITGEAFGIGAFEEPDEDVYSKEDMSSYDFELETADERKLRKSKEALAKAKKKINKDRCIEGFHLAKTTGYKKKFFPPPPLPPNFEPFHNQRKSRFDKPSEVNENMFAKRGLGRHALSVNERQVLLGEEVSSSARRNNESGKIEDNAISSEDMQSDSKNPSTDPDSSVQERVERIKKFVEILQKHSDSTPASSDKLSAISKSGFQPFMRNPEKQDRYEKYLTLVSSGFQDCLKDLQPPEMTEWEREREKQEFERAASIYRPLSGVMSSRFVSGKSHDISHLVPEKEIIKEKDATEDPKVAARLNLFGRLTHSDVEWHPDKILCRRFNIKDPYPNSKFVGLRGMPSKPESLSSNVEFQISVSASPAAPKKSLFDNLDFSKPPPGLPGLKPTEDENSEPPPPGTAEESFELGSSRQVKNLEISPVEKENTPVKPSLDLFREIFADSSEESEQEDEPEPDTTVSKKEDKSNDKPENSSRTGKIILDSKHRSEKKDDNTSSESNTRRRRGIFDNLDLSQFDKQPGDRDNTSSYQRSGRLNEEEEEDLLYGPKAPIKALSNSTVKSNSQSSSTQHITLTASQQKLMALSGSYNITTTKRDTDSGSKSKNTFPVLEEEVVWVEKEAVSQSRSKSKKHSTKKSKKSKSKKTKEKHKKSKKHKSKKSKQRDSSDGHLSDEDDLKRRIQKTRDDVSDDESSSSSSDIEIRGSLDQKALLAHLKQWR